MNQNQSNKGALLRWPQVNVLVGLSRSKITQLEKEGKFPKRQALGSRLVVWKLAEVEKFCADPAGYVAGGQ